MQEADHECMRLQTLHQGSRDRRAVVGMPATSLLLTRTRLGLGQVWPKVEGGSEQGGFAGRLSKRPTERRLKCCWAAGLGNFDCRRGSVYVVVRPTCRSELLGGSFQARVATTTTPPSAQPSPPMRIATPPRRWSLLEPASPAPPSFSLQFLSQSPFPKLTTSDRIGGTATGNTPLPWPREV